MTTESKGALAVREANALSNDFGATMTGAQLKFIANSEFIPKGLRGNLPAIGACVATGRALGLADMTALRSIAIIDGKASFSAELMVSLVRKAGHSITFKASGESCTVYGARNDNDDTGEFEWTLDMAKRAGLLGKDNWKKYPESMLFARAATQLCRMLFADCFAGASYTPEELGAGDITADELMDESAQDPGSGGASPPEPPPIPGTDQGRTSPASDASGGSGLPAGPASESAPDDFAEVVAVTDEPIDEPGPITEGQKDRLLALVASSADKLGNVGQRLTERIKAEYGAPTYTQLNESQMGELLDWLEEQAA